jgi:hypothetical protein
VQHLRAAGVRAFDDLLDMIVRCQESGLLPTGDPRTIAGPIWSLLHGVSMLTIGSDLAHVGINDDPQIPIQTIENLVDSMPQRIRVVIEANGGPTKY